MAKIGHDVIAKSRGVKLHLNPGIRGYKPEYREKIIQFLRSVKRPPCIADVSRATNINYATTRSILMELLLAGLVTRFESGGAVFYQLKKE